MTPLLWSALLVAAALLAAGASFVVRRCALAIGMVDVPNARSSHDRVVARGGGVAIALVVFAGIGLLYWQGLIPAHWFAALVGGGTLVLGVSLVDDYRRVPIAIRLSCHVCAAAWVLACFGGAPELQFGVQVWRPGWLLAAGAALALVWLINLYNFMDGLDGLAAAEAVFVAAAAALLAGWSSSGGLVFGIIAASCGGFLLLNWSPAALFMGDSGSCFLGFLFGALAVACAAEGELPLWVWPILLGVFFVDATLTLLTRALSPDQVWYQPHRSHAYQRLARRVNSHAAVALAVAGCNLLWLLPWAYLAALEPRWGGGAAAAALLPLALLARYLRAGRGDQP